MRTITTKSHIDISLSKYEYDILKRMSIKTISENDFVDFELYVVEGLYNKGILTRKEKKEIYYYKIDNNKIMINTLKENEMKTKKQKSLFTAVSELDTTKYKGKLIKEFDLNTNDELDKSKVTVSLDTLGNKIDTMLSNINKIRSDIFDISITAGTSDAELSSQLSNLATAEEFEKFIQAGMELKAKFSSSIKGEKEMPDMLNPEGNPEGEEGFEERPDDEADFGPSGGSMEQSSGDEFVNSNPQSNRRLRQR